MVPCREKKKTTVDAVYINEHFLTYGAGSTALYGIIGTLIMLIYKHVHSNAHRQVIYIVS